jgi:hypothetical protein
MMNETVPQQLSISLSFLNFSPLSSSLQAVHPPFNHLSNSFQSRRINFHFQERAEVGRKLFFFFPKRTANEKIQLKFNDFLHLPGVLSKKREKELKSTFTESEFQHQFTQIFPVIRAKCPFDTSGCNFPSM